MRAKKPRYRFIVTENGIATEDDTRRVEYFERALAGLISRERLTTESMHCFRNAFRPYRSALLCAKFSAVSQDKPLVELSTVNRPIRSDSGRPMELR
jgi:hypothetical protein